MRLVRIDTDVPPAILAHCLETLAPQDRVHLALDRPGSRRRVVAHAVLRRVLGEHLGIKPRDVRLQRQRWGKPVLAEATHPAVHFSLSYCADEAWLALASTPVGIDVERTAPDDWEAVARHVYAPAEQARLHASADRQQSFLNLWTAKEAVLKLWGTGFQFEPRAFCVPPASTDFQAVHLTKPAPHTPACWIAHGQNAADMRTGQPASLAARSEPKRDSPVMEPKAAQTGGSPSTSSGFRTVAIALYTPPASITWEHYAHE